VWWGPTEPEVEDGAKECVSSGPLRSLPDTPGSADSEVSFSPLEAILPRRTCAILLLRDLKLDTSDKLPLRLP
jgi:hypothetical protein